MGGGSRDGLGKWVPGKFSLKIKERRVLVEETTVARVRWESGPLFVADEIDEGSSLTFPALTIPDSVLLGLLLFVTVTAEGAWVCGGVRARAPLLGMITARQVVEEKAQLPGGTFGGSFGAREPSTGKHVKALAD